MGKVTEMIAPESSPFPEYDRPPVNEVALAVGFDALPVGNVGLAQLAATLRDLAPGYHVAGERIAQPPLPARDEVRGLALRITDAPDPALLLLVDESEQHLLQLQADRLVVNWRKLRPDQPYPSFATILPRFEAAWDALGRGVEDLGHHLTPYACEVTYINAFDVASPIGHVGDVAELVAPWSSSFSDGFLPPPSEVALVARFPLPGGQGSLAIELQPAVRPTGEPALLLSVTARGWPQPVDAAGVLSFFDLAHEWIVRGFTSFTTATMHEIWGRTA